MHNEKPAIKMGFGKLADEIKHSSNVFAWGAIWWFQLLVRLQLSPRSIDGIWSFEDTRDEFEKATCLNHEREFWEVLSLATESIHIRCRQRENTGEGPYFQTQQHLRPDWAGEKWADFSISTATFWSHSFHLQNIREYKYKLLIASFLATLPHFFTGYHTAICLTYRLLNHLTHKSRPIFLGWPKGNNDR